MHNAMEKTSKGKWKKWMTKQVINQALAPSFTHDFKCLWCKSKGKLKRMLVKEWFCNLFEIFFWKWSTPFSANCSKGGTHVPTFGGKSYHADIKCAWKGRVPELLTPITSNKNELEFNKNLKVMTRATKAQLFELNLMPQLKMGKVTCWWTKMVLKHSNESRPKRLLKTPITIE